MNKMFFLLFWTATTVFAGKLTIDFSRIDPLTSAIFRGVEKAFEVNERGLAAMEAGNFEAAEAFFKEAGGMLPIYSDAKNNLGVLYFRADRTADAHELWRQIVNNDPEYAPAWYNLGLFEMKAGNKEKAKEHFERALKEQNDFCWSIHAFISVSMGDTAKAINILEKNIYSTNALLMLGEIYAVRGDFEKAKMYLESLRITGYSNRNYYETLAGVYNELKMFKKTEELFIEAERRGAKISLSFWISYAWALFEQGQKDRAITIMTERSVENPDDKKLKFVLIYFLINNDRFAEAKVILDNIDDVKGLLAFVHINLGDEELAEKLWRELIKADTSNSLALTNLGVLAERRNQPDTALFYFKKALDISENAGVRISVGNIYFEKKQYDSAAIYYTFAQGDEEWRTKAFAGAYFAFIELGDTAYAAKIAKSFATLPVFSPPDDYVLRVLSDRAYRQGDFENVEKLVRGISNPIAEDMQLLQNARRQTEEYSDIAEPNNNDLSAADFLYNRALTLHLAGEIDSAAILYEKLLEIEKNYYRAWNNLGVIYGSQGEIEKAIAAYKNAVSRRADIADGYANLVNIYLAIDDRKNARRWLRRGLRVAPNDENLLFFKKQLEE